jgi:hypothetical protein
LNVKQHQLWDSEAPHPRRRAGVTLPPGLVIFPVADEENFYFGLEKCALDIILYSGQAMLAFMLSF